MHKGFPEDGAHPYFGNAWDDDGALLHRWLELLLSGLMELSDGGLGHRVRPVEHQQLGVGRGQGLADCGAQHRRLLWDATLRQLRLVGCCFLGGLWRGTKLSQPTASWLQWRFRTGHCRGLTVWSMGGKNNDSNRLQWRQLVCTPLIWPLNFVWSRLKKLQPKPLIVYLIVRVMTVCARFSLC